VGGQFDGLRFPTQEAHTEHDAGSAHGGAIQRDYLTQVSASSSQFKRCKALHWTQDERPTLLGLLETDLGVREVIPAEDLEHGLCHPDGHDLPMELDETSAWLHGIAGD
jgi:hypothetical protein